MKTIKQWLETLPSPIREKALANLYIGKEDKEEENLSDALCEGFGWREAKEGKDYWKAINKIIQAGDFDLEEEKTFPREVYVNDISKEDALNDKQKRICLGELNWKYICVLLWQEETFNDCKDFTALFRKYIVEIPEEKTITIKVSEEQEKFINNYLEKWNQLEKKC